MTVSYMFFIYSIIIEINLNTLRDPQRCPNLLPCVGVTTTVSAHSAAQGFLCIFVSARDRIGDGLGHALALIRSIVTTRAHAVTHLLGGRLL